MEVPITLTLDNMEKGDADFPRAQKKKKKITAVERKF